MKTKNIIKELESRIWTVLTVRESIWCAAGWFFLLGVAVLTARMLTHWPTHYLVGAVLGVVPIVLLVASRKWRQRPSEESLRAYVDQYNEAGGMVVAEASADMKRWEGEMPRLDIPEFRWRSRRPMTVFVCASVFLAITFLIPEKHLGYVGKNRLEVGHLIDEISEEIGVLEEEEILEEEKATDLEEQLNKLAKEATAQDPAKTWEALDNLKDLNSNLAEQAVEEAIKKLESLKQTEALAGALGMMPKPNDDVLTKGIQDLAAMLSAAKLEEGLMKGKIDENLLKAAAAGKLDNEQLQKLIEAIKNNKKKFGECAAKLANMRMIDPDKLGQCDKAGNCPNPKALADFLAKMCQGDSDCAAIAKMFCRNPGITRGRGDAPMTWQDPSSFDGTANKDQMLPTGSLESLKDSQFIENRRSVPEVTGHEVEAGKGALNAAKGGGGSAQVQQLLPRHKGAVERFFERKREE